MSASLPSSGAVLDQADPAADPESFVTGRVLDDSSSVTFSLITSFPICFSLLVVLDGNRDGLGPLLRRFPRAAEEQERQRQADPGQHDAGQEGGLEALVQHDERVRTSFAAR